MDRSIKALIFGVIIAFYSSGASVKCMRARVLGGRDATDNEIKYIVSIICGNSACGGGIIDDKLIITAAHCVKLNETTGTLLQPMRIIAATNTLVKNDESKGVVIDVTRAFLPTVFNGVNDIAILELKESLELEKNRDKLQKLHLPVQSESDATDLTHDNVQFKFAGYGKSHVDMVTDEKCMVHYYPSSGGRLKVANAIIVDKKTCEASWGFKISDKRMCISITEDETKKNRQGTCFGDSGSPAVIDGKFLVGILSAGNFQCDNNYIPSLFTRVSSYIDFIQNIMKGKTNEAVIYYV